MASFLVIDDDLNDRRLLKQALLERGHSVIELESGRLALKMIETHRVDGVALDLIMPEVEGAETLQSIKRIHPDLPVVVMSGLGKDYLPMMAHLGAVGVVEKSSNFDQVCDVLEQSQS